MEKIERHCKSCGITLSEFEEMEYIRQCIDCYKEENQTVKANKNVLPILIKRGRKRVFTA